MPDRHDDPELLLRLLDLSPGLVMLVDGELVIRWINQTAADLFDYTPDEIIGRSVLDFLDPDWDPAAFESIATAMGGQGMRQPMLFRVVGPDGSRSILEVTANSQFHDPSIDGMVCFARPWSERYLLDQALDAMAARREVPETLGLLVGVASAETMAAPASFVYDLDGDGRAQGIQAADGLAPELTGPAPGCTDEVAAAWASLLAAPEGDVRAVDQLPEVLRGPAEAAGLRTLWLWPSDHRIDEVPSAWSVAWRAEDHLDIDQTRRQMMARLARLAGLVVDRARDEEATAHAARHDVLTGLPNRAAFYDVLEEHLAGGAADVAVLYLDLDGFKPVNDRYGHGAGDRVLTAVGRRLAAATPAEATVARLGGDEFAVVCAGPVDDDELVALAGALTEALAAPVELRAGETVAVGVSIGIARCAAGTGSSDALVDAADRALYEAKRTGGGIRVGAPVAPGPA